MWTIVLAAALASGPGPAPEAAPDTGLLVALQERVYAAPRADAGAPARWFGAAAVDRLRLGSDRCFPANEALPTAFRVATPVPDRA